jgi:cysteine desulfurase
VALDQVYLDYNATSPLSVSVSNWLKSGDLNFANPSSQHSAGKSARKEINQTRLKIFKTFNKKEDQTDLFFHSGATEAMVTFAHAFAEEARIRSKKLLICFSKLDHPAVTSLPGLFLGDHVEHFELSLKSDLDYDHQKNLDALKNKKSANPDLIILYHHLWIHNETGFVSPLSELQDFKGIPELYIHVDAVQSPGKIPSWRELEVGDIWSFSAHKFGALKGVGFTLINKDVPFYPLILGGGQQKAMRGGTENPLAIKSIALALFDLELVDVVQTTHYKEEFEAFLEKELSGIGGVVKGSLRNSNTIYFYFNSLSSDITLALFDLNGLMLSAGSACSSGAARPSQVMIQLGLNEMSKNGLRLSMGFSLDRVLLEDLKKRFQEVISKIKSR